MSNYQKKDEIKPVLLTVKETSKYLNMGETKTREFLKMPNNKFTVRLKGRLFVYKPLLDEWLQNNCKER